MNSGILTASTCVFTIGHSTRSWPDFIDILHHFAIANVVDVRRLPGSRKYPQFDQDRMRTALAAEHIDYTHIAALGGRRKRQCAPEDSPNGLWRNVSFRHYADYALSDAFVRGLAQLLELAQTQRVVIMCAEAVWWRCHRRIITDHLLARGIQVRHIMDKHKAPVATMTPGACIRQDVVVYPAAD